jgi:hypothetical protein
MSYFKGGRAASFTERILQQELRSGKMCFTSWHDFTEEFAATFCPENKATTALMRLESNWYYQGKQNVEAYIVIQTLMAGSRQPDAEISTA